MELNRAAASAQVGFILVRETHGIDANPALPANHIQYAAEKRENAQQWVVTEANDTQEKVNV